MPEIAVKWGLKEIILLLIALALGVVMAIWAMGVPWTSFLGLKLEKEAFGGEAATATEGEYSSRLYTSLDYGGFIHPIEPAAGEVGIDPPLTWSDIKNELSVPETVYNCSECKNCLTIASAPNEAEECDSCDSCEVDGTPVTGTTYRFRSCGVCELCDATMVADGDCPATGWVCNDCEDQQGETEICQALTEAIKNAYLGITQDDRTLLADFPHSGALNPGELLQMIRACPKKSITLRKGDIDQEICYLNPELITLESEQTSYSYSNSGTGKHLDDNCDGGSGWCSGKQTIDLQQNTAVVGFHGIWTPGTEDAKEKKRYFFLCKGECPGFFALAKSETLQKIDVTVKQMCDAAGLPYSISPVCLFGDTKIAELGPDTFVTSCSRKNVDGCVMDWSTCENCLHSSQFFNFGYEGVVRNVGARVCTEWWSNDDYVLLDCQDRSSNALDDVQLEVNVGPGLTYAQCELDISPGTNRFYYNDYSDIDALGHMRLRLSGLQAEKQRDCYFNLQLCNERSFAPQQDSSIINLFDFTRDFNPYNAHRTYYKNGYGTVIWDSFNIELDQTYTPKDIENSLKAGWREWVNNNNPDYFGTASVEPLNHFVLDTLEPDAISTDANTCKNPDIDFTITNRGNMYYNCPTTGCAGNLTVRFAMTWADNKMSASKPFVSFCSSE